MSLYLNNTEVAWMTFWKTTGSAVDWFDSSNLLEAYPWDINLLRSSTTVFRMAPNSQYVEFSKVFDLIVSYRTPKKSALFIRPLP